MGKVTSLYGKTTGKIGSIVFSTSGGETIAREYNPHVANPSTQAQVDQRARMKLMSQLSASLSPVIAMTKEGLVSRRNKFVKKNFDNSYALSGVAQISYENIQLTEGSTGLPQVVMVADADFENRASIYLASEPSVSISRVVYCIFQKSQENRLQYIKSLIATTRASTVSGRFFEAFISDIPTSITGSTAQFTSEYVVYAYGMSDTSEKATARYGNLNVQSASDIANLVANRTISYEDYQFTQTRGTTVGNGSGGGEPVPAGKARVFVTALGQGGSVTGGGTFEIGSQVTVEATVNTGYSFRGWVLNGSSKIISSQTRYTFTLQGQIDLVATFEVDGL